MNQNNEVRQLELVLTSEELRLIIWSLEDYGIALSKHADPLITRLRKLYNALLNAPSQ